MGFSACQFYSVLRHCDKILVLREYCVKLFNVSGYLDGELHTEDGQVLEFDKLPAFLRVLLSADGTVTKILESFFWEPVTVLCDQQSVVTLAEEIPGLSKKSGDSVFVRDVRLSGEHSTILYATANSMIVPELLPDLIYSKLVSGQIGIGELLRECGLETYREIIAFGSDSNTVWRKYRIVQNAKPIMQITEHFPLAVYHVND